MQLAVVNGTKDKTPKVTVHMDGETTQFKEFIVVGYDPHTCKVSSLYNADPVTLAMAVDVVRKAFIEAFDNASAEDKKTIEEILLRGDE